jgi:zinc D-Ala-D-Ala dipeptidase
MRWAAAIHSHASASSRSSTCETNVEECSPVQTYADAKALINDPRVLACRMADNGEPFVDVRTVPSLACDTTREGVQTLSDNPFQLRTGALDRLMHAQASLPDGYQFQVKEAWRPIWVQEQLWARSLGRLRDIRPDLTDEELRTENARFTAPPDSAPPHSTGGTVDLVLLKDGEPTDMGWGFNQPGAGSRTAYMVGDDARRYRDILAHAMDVAGFINYPEEWWHWSYGDRYWAFQTSAEAALYGPR